MATKDVAVELSDLPHGDFKTPSNSDSDDVVADAVPEKYRGTDLDHHDMRALGKTQVLRRNFKLLGMIAFANSVMVMWETFLVVSGLGLSVGGRAAVFWGMIYGAVALTSIYVTIAEMASIAPTAGGQYHWVSELAPPRFQGFLSYITGWLVSMGWISYLTLVSFTAGTTTQGLAVLNHPTYVPQAWHSTLLCWAVVGFGFLFNTVLAPRLPAVEIFFFILHVVGWFGIFITLLVLGPRHNPYDTFLVLHDTAGWNSVGLATVITMANSVAMFVGYESPVHMSEETQNASRIMPRVIKWSVIMNLAMTIALCGIYITSIEDLERVLKTPFRVPFIQVLFDVTNSKAGTTVMASIVIVELISACISEGACASRQLWSFARDQGLPGSNWLSQVSEGFNIPVHSILTTVIIVALISLINIGSSAALNAINSLGGISILSTYLIVVGCYIWNRSQNVKPPRGQWSRYGMYYAIVGWLSVLPVFFFLLWPLFANPDAANM
ncbi:hypothetical protein LTR37_010896 [Vermiconidia calcicola]|uniref:Uncharacterized protein n=1 Tax=Vermiconidia calcicola TaxID=1690605 RepID=A0ACC3N3V5_9PEZI|nr:hypothetical protein LTR37_010896 [Vermiconidia calcicola]